MPLCYNCRRQADGHDPDPDEEYVPDGETCSRCGYGRFEDLFEEIEDEHNQFMSFVHGVGLGMELMGEDYGLTKGEWESTLRRQFEERVLDDG